jgi:hypothetical protein
VKGPDENIERVTDKFFVSREFLQIVEGEPARIDHVLMLSGQATELFISRHRNRKQNLTVPHARWEAQISA